MFEQDRVLVRLQQRVLQERDILVCFLSGSFGRGTADEFSDLDVALVFVDESRREIAYRQRREFAQSVLPYVPAKSFDASHIRPFFHIALYSNGAKVDYRYETQDTLEPTAWDREIRLLKDTAGWGEAFQAAASRLSPTITLSTITTEALTSLDERFWVMFMDVYRLLRRGDHSKPFPIYLQLLYHTLPQLLALLPPEDAAHQGLIRIRYDHDTQATAAGLSQLLDAYLAARSAVVKRHKLAFMANDSFERELRRRLK